MCTSGLTGMPLWLLKIYHRYILERDIHSACTHGERMGHVVDSRYQAYPVQYVRH